MVATSFRKAQRESETRTRATFRTQLREKLLAALSFPGTTFVVPQREFRTGDVFYARDGVQRHRLPGGIADKKLADVLRVCAVIAFGLDVSLPCSSEAIEIVHKKSAHERL